MAHAALKAWPVDARDSLPLVLWSAREIAAATGGTASHDFQVSGVEMDSRDVRGGDLFVALKGEAMDGHKFIAKAFENGAVAAIVDRPVDFPHILVEDTTKALHALAHAARERASAVRIGVTGSVGKTGVKEAIFAALDRSSRGATHRSIRSYNNHVGVPLTLARMPARSKFGVFEMGMNHAGEIDVLTKHVRPNVAVITTIAPAHIENLGSEEAIADAKAEIFGGLEPGGVAIIPADSPHYARLKEAAERHNATTVSFGRAEFADVRLLDAIPSANGGSLVTADLGDTRLCYSVAEPGEHWITNSLAVMAAVRAAGGDLGSAGLALAEMGGLKGRGARHSIPAPGGKALLIDESYNANPASMRATLRQLGQTPAMRRIAVLGSMKELGDFAPSFHAQLIEPLVDAKIDHVIMVGEEMRSLARELGKQGGILLGNPGSFAHCDTPEQAIAALDDFGIASGDAILVKGSNSIGLGRLVAHFSGRDG
ncbi:UDP-N-acetylmuramoylalanyl-D-glutamyl-2,6-diaminopimelate--D-alanyl-D-alanine ligase [Altererythrobacter epoxidivorans]|uniref:UDP-N-acetylmuramoyl-tripeptide--D-alanyl-D-alanine ligase n=1 Tax=Altererythrobacter epoxidivorans TaxID=361183 RepID=A0A0M5KYT0_9SPHN|nr:UDP-N-acetylmuramoyl-tripeptide--D-alanyl-D-alanine ligase [Altererythrobacter epoxidivorans]ALE17157.1 UDP-N-acetylmuramoylalanyl-D-glutamyl-2,6-diaminopimelate--D-alanyl-D-alanine ligase [Altererythrobacter epoxidivorans]